MKLNDFWVATEIYIFSFILESQVFTWFDAGVAHQNPTETLVAFHKNEIGGDNMHN